MTKAFGTTATLGLCRPTQPPTAPPKPTGAAITPPLFRSIMTWAKQGDPRAQNMIGLMYLRGQGVAQSQRIASEWLRRAAMQGNADAQFHLGILYAAQPEMAPSEKEASFWLVKSAERGNSEAQYTLATQYATGQGPEAG
jgi:TPR repeat protein